MDTKGYENDGPDTTNVIKFEATNSMQESDANSSMIIETNDEVDSLLINKCKTTANISAKHETSAVCSFKNNSTTSIDFCENITNTADNSDKTQNRSFFMAENNFLVSTDDNCSSGNEKVAVNCSLNNENSHSIDIDNEKTDSIDVDDETADSIDQVTMIMTAGQVHIWTAKEFYTLKTKFRIVGKLVGPIPRKPRNPEHFGLPLILMPEEVTFLLEKGFGYLIQYTDLCKPLSEEIKNDCKKLEEELYQEQCDYVKKKSIENLISILDNIVKGKKKKLEKKAEKDPEAKEKLKTVSRETVFSEECKKINKLPKDKQVIQQFLLPPYLEKLNFVQVDWKFPTTPKEIVRYKVFKDLWEQKYFLTCGLKFGVDFLAYPGDPLIYHASLTVLVIEDDTKPLDILTLMGTVRVSNTVKKTLVLASCDENDKVNYISWKWHNL